MNNPTGTLKRVCLALVVLLLASAVLVGAVSAEEEAYAGYDTVTVTTQDEFIAAINAVTPTNATVIVLSGTNETYIFPMPNYAPAADMTQKTIVFTADGNKKLDMLTLVGTNCGHVQGANLTFDSVELDLQPSGWFVNGYAAFSGGIAELSFRNCTINGMMYLYIDAEFINCDFNNTENYCVNPYGNNVTFTDCTFDTAGKAVVVHNEYEAHATVTLNNCTFSSDSSIATDEAAIEVLASNYDYGDKHAADTTYEIIIINGCTILNGFAAHNSTSPLWGNKNSMDAAHLKVTINGVEQKLVYPVTWKNYDGTILESDLVEEGASPEYNSAVPTKQKSETEIFQFDKWTPELATVTGAVTYTATFTASPIEVDADVNVTTETTDAGTKVTVKEGDIAYEGENANAVTKATITTASNVNVTLIYSAEDKAKVDETQKTITGNVTEVVAEYPETLLDSDVSGIKYELKLNLKPETVANGEIPLPNITTTLDADVKNAIGLKTGGDGEAFKPLAMIAAEYAGGIDKVNNNLTGDEKITLTFVVPATAGQSFVAFHIDENGVPELLDANKVKTDSTSKPGFVIITLTVDHFSGYAIAEGTYPVVKKETSSSSSSSGSSVWLMETQTPTPTPTPTETEKPTDAVPTDIPVTQPTETPASPAFGALTVLAGLGAVAVLRRK